VKVSGVTFSLGLGIVMSTRRQAEGDCCLAHLPEGGFGGDAAVHEPDALGFAVLVLDRLEEAGQRGFVGGVAGHHFVGQQAPHWRGREEKWDDRGGNDRETARRTAKKDFGAGE